MLVPTLTVPLPEALRDALVARLGLGLVITPEMVEEDWRTDRKNVR